MESESTREAQKPNPKNIRESVRKTEKRLWRISNSGVVKRSHRISTERERERERD